MASNRYPTVFAPITLALIFGSANVISLPLNISQSLPAYGQTSSVQPSGWIGMQLKQDEITKQPIVETIIPGGVAEKAGLKSGDIILEVDGRSTFNDALDQDLDQLGGLPGSAAKLSIQRGEKIFVVNLVQVLADDLLKEARSKVRNNSNDALEKSKKALNFYMRIEDQLGEGNAYFLMGAACFYLQDFQASIEYLNKVSQIILQKDLTLPTNKSYMALANRSYILLGSVYLFLGEYQEAIKYQNLSLQIALQTGGKKEQGAAYGNLGTAYQELGDYQKAIEYQNLRLPIVQSEKDLLGIGQVYSNLGIAYVSLGDSQKAIEYGNKRLEIALTKDQQGGTDKQGESYAYGNLGNAYQLQGDYQKAIEYHRKSLQIALQIGDKIAEGGAYDNLGLAYEKLGNFDEALQLQQKAITIFKTIGIDQNIYESQWAIARIFAAQDQPDLAILFYKQAVNTIQSTRERIKSIDPILKKLFAASKSSIYRQLADLLLSRGRLLEALQVLELLKEQEVIEYLHSALRGSSSGANVIFTEAETEGLAMITKIQSEEIDLYKQRFALQKEIKNISPAQQNDGNSDQVRLQVQREQIEEKIQMLSQSYPPLFGRISASLKAISLEKSERQLRQSIGDYRLALQGKRAVIIYPLLLPNRLELLLLTPDQSLPIRYTLKVSKGKVDALILKLRSKLFYHEDANAELRQLHKWLVEPFKQELARLDEKQRIDTLVFAPDSNLRLVPLSALYDGKHYLIERYSISTISRINRRVASPLPQQLLAMGISKNVNGLQPLPAAAVEINYLSKLFPATTLLDEKFTRNNLQTTLDTLGNVDKIIHIASHASFGVNKDTSFIQMWGNERLSFSDLYRLNLSGVRLLTLSACETAVEDPRTGIGLAASSEEIGIESVVGSLWQVNDVATSHLMETFYSNLKKKLPTAEALRQAQLCFLNDRGSSESSCQNVSSSNTKSANYRNPYYWAAFVLLGSWR